jgi:hypothetical protein
MMSIIEELNFAQDARNGAPAGVPTVTICVCECGAEEGGIHEGQCEHAQAGIATPVSAEQAQCDEERELPWRWDVCPVCDGKGRHVNPNIDCNGLTAEDFAEDPDFAEDYRRGCYDQPCNRCRGRTTVPVVDEERCTEHELAALEAAIDAEAEMRACYLAELRAGA